MMHRLPAFLPPRRPRLFLHLLFAFALVAAFLPGPAGAATASTVQQMLSQQAQAGPEQTFRVIVRRDAANPAAENYLAQKGYAKLKDVASLGFVTTVKGKDIAELGKQPGVQQVSIDAQMTPTILGWSCSQPLGSCNLGPVYPTAVNADQDWNNNLGGNGIGVAVVDSGINANLADFGSGGWSSRVVAQAQFSSNSPNLTDYYGHGTHVAGIVGGNSWWSGVATKGKYLGAAPQANLVSVKVSDSNGMAYVSDVVNGIDWVISNRQTYNTRVLNLSLISSVAESYTTSVLDAEVEKAWFNGILVVVSAGNAGPNTEIYPPANDPFVVTVGAADPVGTTSVADDTITSWSSYGTTQDGFSKPDAVAPGRSITSLLASPSETLAQQFPNNLVDSNYLTLSGTSMAAPVVSGAAALIFRAHPSWTNDQVKWLLVQTARRLGSTSSGVFTPYPGQGGGEIDAAASANYASTPAYANQGLTISPLLIGPNGQTTYNNGSLNTSSSWSTSSWSTTTRSTSASSTSSWSTSSWSTTSSTTSTWSQGSR